MEAARFTNSKKRGFSNGKRRQGKEESNAQSQNPPCKTPARGAPDVLRTANVWARSIRLTIVGVNGVEAKPGVLEKRS
jgi:hypothetical protein